MSIKVSKNIQAKDMKDLRKADQWPHSAIGIAGKELLSSYSLERQPVGLDVVTQ
jgi:hypothetical protein